MSVSSRDRKSIIYAEVERLRDLLDRQDQQLRAQSEELARKDQQLRSQSEEIERLRALLDRPQSSGISERRAQIEVVRAFARKFRCSARWNDGTIELYSRKRGCWVAVPEGTQP